MRYNNLSIVLFVFVGFLLLILLLQQHPQYSVKTRDEKYQKHYDLIENWYNCITNQLDTKTLNYSNKAVSNCEKVIPKEIVIKDFRNKDETKRHIMPVRNIDFLMNLISLGIGKDTKAETLLKNATSQRIHMYGCDPVTDVNAALYSKIGDYFPFAISDQPGYSDASVYVGGRYKKQSVIHIDFIYFLTDIIKQNLIDVLWMDAEGAEYGLMPMFYRGGLLDQHGIVVCQLNVEIHDIKKEENNLLARQLFHQLLQDKRYIASKPYSVYHHRWYFVNFEHPTCIDRYLKF